MGQYENLVKALRCCAENFGCPIECPRYSPADEGVRACVSRLENDAAAAIEALKAQLPKRGKWLKTDAFPHRVYCSCCYKTYVPNANWQIWQDDADNFGLPRNYCPNCGAKMREVQE